MENTPTLPPIEGRRQFTLFKILYSDSSLSSSPTPFCYMYLYPRVFDTYISKEIISCSHWHLHCMRANSFSLRLVRLQNFWCDEHRDDVNFHILCWKKINNWHRLNANTSVARQWIFAFDAMNRSIIIFIMI